MVSITDLESKNKDKVGRKNSSTKTGLDFLINPVPFTLPPQETERKLPEIKVEENISKQQAQKIELEPTILLEAKEDGEQKKRKNANRRSGRESSNTDAYKEGVKLQKGFLKIPNNLLGRLLFEYALPKSDMQVAFVLIRLSLGFQKNWAEITQNEISSIVGINSATVNKIIKRLEEHGMIEIRVGENNKQYYVLSKALLEDDEDYVLEALRKYEQSKSRSGTTIETVPAMSMYSPMIDKILSGFNSASKFKEMNQVNFLLVEKSYTISQIEECLMDMEGKGALNREKVDRPFSYLASGTMDKILARIEGKSTKSFDGKRIFDILCSVNTREGMTPEVAEQFTEAEKGWIENKGGLAALGSMNSDNLKRELRIN